MSLSIHSLQHGIGTESYYTTEWHVVVESHLQWLLRHPDTRVIPIDPHDAFKFEADLDGLLLSLNIPEEMFFIVMRLNNLASPSDFSADTTQLIVPMTEIVRELMSAHLTLNKKIT